MNALLARFGSLVRDISILCQDIFESANFLCGFKNFHVHMCPHSLSVRQLIVKYSPAHAKISSPIFVNNCFIDKIVPPSTVSLI